MAYQHHINDSSNLFLCKCSCLVDYVYSYSTNLAFLIPVKWACVLKAYPFFWQKKIGPGFSLASLKENSWLANFILKLTWHASATDLFWEFRVKYVAAQEVLMKEKPRIPANCQWISYLVDQTSSNPEEPVLTWLWISIPAGICKYCSTTLGSLILPWCLHGFPSRLAQQVNMNCFSWSSLKRTQIIVSKFSFWQKNLQC